jgi:hypothetical protein
MLLTETTIEAQQKVAGHHNVYHVMSVIALHESNMVKAERVVQAPACT